MTVFRYSATRQEVDSAVMRWEASVPRNLLIQRSGRLVLPYAARRSVGTECKQATRELVRVVGAALGQNAAFGAFLLGLAQNESGNIPFLQAYTGDETQGWGVFQFNDGAMKRYSDGDDFGTNLSAAQATTSMRGGRPISVAYQLSPVGQIIAPAVVYAGVWKRGRYLLAQGKLDAQHGWVRSEALAVWERLSEQERVQVSPLCIAAGALAHVYHGGPGYWMLPFPFGRLDEPVGERTPEKAAWNLNRTKERYEYGLHYIERNIAAL